MPDELRNPTVRFEATDINARAVTLTGLWVFGGTVVTILALWLPFSYMRHADVRQPGRQGLAPQFEQLREPLLQSLPRHDLQVMRAEEDKALSGYRWVDKAGGFASVPIGKAIEAVAQRGVLPPPDGTAGTLGAPMAGKRATGYEVRVLMLPGEP